MKNKTALQTLIAWGDEMMRQEPMKLLSFAEAIDKAKELLEMEEKQIKQSYMSGQIDGVNQLAGLLDEMNQQPKGYYKETYKTNKQ